MPTSPPEAEHGKSNLFLLYAHPDCHLCHRLEDQVLHRLPEAIIEHRNIRTNLDWLRTYRDRIPVLEHDGTVILEGNPSEADIERALAAFC